MSNNNIISFQTGLFNKNQEIFGCKEFTERLCLLERLNSLLDQSGIESDFMHKHIQRKLAEKQEKKGKEATLNVSEIRRHSKFAIQALRCNIVGFVYNDSLRELSIRLADSSSLQEFCHLGDFQRVNIPSKSKLSDFRNIFPVEDIQQIMDKLTSMGSKQDNPLQLEDPLKVSDVYVDSTCLMANIHFPVDWVLLCDGCRTILKAIIIIRKNGLKHRISAPEKFLRKVNKFSIEMANLRRKKDAKKLRKIVLRKLLNLTRCIEKHARRYCNLLKSSWQKTSLKEGEVKQILKRLNSMIDQLPEARSQARSRIISEIQVPNNEKILSLYDNNVNVIKRGKMTAEVEFGNELYLAEQENGLIVDWQLFSGSACAESRKLPASLERITGKFGCPDSITSDRGFDSKSNRDLLKGQGVFNGLAARNLKEMSKLMKDEEYAQKQRRRGQTEARISIIKNNFLGGRAASRNFVYRERQTGWAILVHNLWVIARLPQAEESVERKTA